MKDAKSDDVAEAVDESAAGSIDEHKEKGAAQAPETAKANTVNRTNLRSDYKHYVKAFGLGPILTIIAWTAISEFLMKSPSKHSPLSPWSSKLTCVIRRVPSNLA